MPKNLLPRDKRLRKKLICLEYEIKESKEKQRKRCQHAWIMLEFVLCLHREELQRISRLRFTPLPFEVTLQSRLHLESEITQIEREMMVLAQYLY